MGHLTPNNLPLAMVLLDVENKIKYLKAYINFSPIFTFIIFKRIIIITSNNNFSTGFLIDL
jgi:hypothetical protein